MDLLLAFGIAAALVAVASIAGIALKRREGRASDAKGEWADASELALDALPVRATLLQFSSEYCARCPGTARALGEIAGDDHELAHVELDVAAHPELAARFRVTQTPTVVVLGSDGHALRRFSGAPRRADVSAALPPTPEHPRNLRVA
ncbi:thioredoxin family protein [Agromyces sp. SYSU T00194]|uniref:thioredoxin family protein n=1 Tax=Agromyces chitinivorans TaxID=3158560 RepID=UPI003393CC59